MGRSLMSRDCVGLCVVARRLRRRHPGGRWRRYVGRQRGTGGSSVVTGIGGSLVRHGRGRRRRPVHRVRTAPAGQPVAAELPDCPRHVGDDEQPRLCDGLRQRDAMEIAVDGINATTGVTGDLVNWGLDLFADGTNACGTIDAVGVPFGPGAAQGIADALARRTTSGGDMANPSYRPTRNAVAAATAYLTGQTTANRGFVVLVTTGVPGCAAGANDQLTDDSAAAVQAVTDAFNAGFETFVVGLGELDEAAQASLVNMAVAGAARWARPDIRATSRRRAATICSRRCARSSATTKAARSRSRRPPTTSRAASIST